jgi:hypothetical protein
MASPAIALAKNIAVKTDPPVLKMGVDPRIVAPRPDLAGQRLMAPGQSAIYIVDPNGYLRHIPDPATYNNLFRDWNGVIIDVNLIDIAQGPPLTPGAVLALGSGTSPVYLVTNGVKDWITSPAAMDKYYFNWGRVLTVPDVLVDFIPNGINWS